MKSLCSFLIVALAVAASMLPSVYAQDCLAHACMSCKVKGRCNAGTKMLEDDGECPTAEACTLLNGIPSCVPFAQTSCDCDGGKQGCDPIDNTKKIYCVRGSLYTADCGDGQQCTGTGQCMATTPAPETTPPPMCPDASSTGFSLIEPNCRAALFCAMGNEIDVTECQEAEYFDLSSGNCEPYPPSNPCGCGMDKCPVIGNCSNYLLCDGDLVLDEETCSVDGMTFFDPATGDCVADGTAESVCTDYTECDLPEVSYTTTTTPTPTTTATTTPTTTTTTTPTTTTTTTPTTTTITTPTTTTTTTPTTTNNTTPTITTATTPTTTTTTTPTTTTATTPTTTTATTPTTTTTTTPTTTTPTTPTTTTATTPTTTTPTTPTTTTTPKPATCSAANAGKRYPHETDCKKYYTCREITRGRYQYVESKCLGDLVFDKVNRYCNVPEKVPDCQQ